MNKCWLAEAELEGGVARNIYMGVCVCVYTRVCVWERESGLV